MNIPVNIPVIRYVGFDGTRLWIIPSKEGFEHFKSYQPIMTSDKGIKYPLKESEVLVGGNKVMCYEIDLKESILNLTHNVNLPANLCTLRVYTSDQDNKYLVIPYVAHRHPSYTPVPI